MARMTSKPVRRTKIFISYSHRDKDWLARLQVHLKPLEREYELDIWDDTKIVPGSKWRDDIEQAVASAKVAVLLVSADFLASDFIGSDELPSLLSAAEKDGAIILPLILSPSRFVMTKGLNQFQSLNDPSTPLIGLPRSEQEAVLVRSTTIIESSLTPLSPLAQREESATPNIDVKRGMAMSSQQTHQALTLRKGPTPIKIISMTLLILVAAVAIASWVSGGRPARSELPILTPGPPAPNINVLDEGLRPGDPKYDNTPKFNELLDKLGPVRTIYFPSGAYYFNSRPKLITKNVVIVGDGINATSFIRNYDGGNYDEALIHTQRTIAIERVGILAASGTGGGGAVRLEGESASSSVLRDLYITGQPGGTFAIPLTLYSIDDKGIRGCNIDNVKLFAATLHLAWFVNVRGLTAKLDAYPAGGTVDYITVQGVDAGLKSDNVQIDTTHLVRMWVYTTNNLTLRTPGTLVIKDTVSTNIIKNGEVIKR